MCVALRCVESVCIVYVGKGNVSGNCHYATISQHQHTFHLPSDNSKSNSASFSRISSGRMPISTCKSDMISLLGNVGCPRCFVQWCLLDGHCTPNRWTLQFVRVFDFFRLFCSTWSANHKCIYLPHLVERCRYTAQMTLNIEWLRFTDQIKMIENEKFTSGVSMQSK